MIGVLSVGTTAAVFFGVFLGVAGVASALAAGAANVGAIMPFHVGAPDVGATNVGAPDVGATMLFHVGAPGVGATSTAAPVVGAAALFDGTGFD